MKESRGGYSNIMYNKLNIKKAKRDKGNYILTEVSIRQENITIISICKGNDRPSKYMKKKWTEAKGEIHSSTIVHELNTSVTTMDRTARWKISKESEDVKKTNQLDLADIYRIFYLNNHFSQVYTGHFPGYTIY